MKFRVFWDVLPCSQIDADIDLRTGQKYGHYSQDALHWNAHVL
jgi:hypothetical protein